MSTDKKQSLWARILGQEGKATDLESLQLNNNANKSTPDLQKIREIAEAYYREGDYYCSEAVVKTIRDEFQLDYPDDVIAMASGFPVGMGGSGCTCGAVTGGIMALGMVFGRKDPKDKKIDKTMVLAKELHDIFKHKHKSLCCRVLTKDMKLGSSKHMQQCISLTGEVAEDTARIIARELGHN